MKLQFQLSILFIILQIGWMVCSIEATTGCISSVRRLDGQIAELYMIFCIRLDGRELQSDSNAAKPVSIAILAHQNCFCTIIRLNGRQADAVRKPLFRNKR